MDRIWIRPSGFRSATNHRSFGGSREATLEEGWERRSISANHNNNDCYGSYYSYDTAIEPVRKQLRPFPSTPNRVHKAIPDLREATAYQGGDRGSD